MAIVGFLDGSLGGGGSVPAWAACHLYVSRAFVEMVTRSTTPKVSPSRPFRPAVAESDRGDLSMGEIL